jgi:hypothetical protein
VLPLQRNSIPIDAVASERVGHARMHAGSYFALPASHQRRKVLGSLDLSESCERWGRRLDVREAKRVGGALEHICFPGANEDGHEALVGDRVRADNERPDPADQQSALRFPRQRHAARRDGATAAGADEKGFSVMI